MLQALVRGCLPGPCPGSCDAPGPASCQPASVQPGSYYCWVSPPRASWFTPAHAIGVAVVAVTLVIAVVVTIAFADELGKALDRVAMRRDHRDGWNRTS